MKAGENISEQNRNKVSLRNMELKDLEEVARVHQEAFGNSFLTALGREAIKRYYDYQLTSGYRFHPILTKIDGKIIGFCFGGHYKNSLKGYLRRNFSFLFFLLLFKPWIIFKKNFFKTLSLALIILLFPKYLQIKKDEKITEIEEQSYGILSICVLPEFQGLGAAKLMMIESEKKAIEWGYKLMRLTVSEDNLRAINFYKKLGYVEYKNESGSIGMMKMLKKEKTI
ncbi:MAG: GNAT family N-acetyltransferase [Acidobacteria bacterium]|nr:GNAT family N-acetyltransferase [Acidobacteriota bacterium]